MKPQQKSIMRPKYLPWLGFLTLALSWYMLDPEARRSSAIDFAVTTAGMTTAGVAGPLLRGR
jgi:predicted benzoate:H+ symporter BenE